jgi:hypothetical protein
MDLVNRLLADDHTSMPSDQRTYGDPAIYVKSQSSPKKTSKLLRRERCPTDKEWTIMLKLQLYPA